MKRGLFILLLCIWLSPAQAHKPSDSYLSLAVHGQRIEGQWDIALRDLDFAIGLDGNGDGALTWDEIRARHAAIAAYALQRLQVASDQGACPLQAVEQLIDRHTDGAYNVLRFQATCPGAAPASVSIGYTLFADLDPQHKGLLKIDSGGATQTAIFDPDSPRQTISLTAPDRLAQFGAYVRHGIWHIWIGYDHILFLLSLLLPAVLLPGLRERQQGLKAAFYDVLKVVTAFTLAHSITLSLASLSLVSLPSRWVESAIAASVILAALNNLLPLFRSKRPVAAFAFGLIHGFGFASVLRDLGLPQGSLLASLLGFNVGVEIGQLAIVAAFLPVAWLLRKTGLYRQVLTVGSLAIALVACVWLVERVADIKLISA
ncbi:HupE/UreJ family protein [Janthinobacterium sp. GW460P]|uniref:HupE/UreJ family protein n=1 Tax=unclassified Janthinobacterium TaxID=2610881 RepID=UPI000A329D4A|nr:MULTISPECIES: HupE/UreJ family protein [unclassified Janthinobacterium]MCC7702773.1 HupE/UreJ family protein [Janthinobacterium sp. GW460P]MCC7708281.1 HupE/UreJ family protein [Janthinobacterium sp. GW460W]